MLKRLLARLTSVPTLQGPEVSRTLGSTATVTRRNVIRSGMRTFKAGEVDRLSESWNPSGYNIDSALRISLRKMRNRSREQFFNNEYAKRFYGLLKSNVLGFTGITLQVKALDLAGHLDRDNNTLVEKAWKKWGKRGNCDVTRKLSFLDLLKIALETTARDGEIFIRKIHGFNNDFGFALQLLEADLVDDNLNQFLPNGNTIRLGIEFDVWGAPVAYWFLTRHPGDYLYGAIAGTTHVRVLASEIIHLHAPEFIRQSRGYPWGHAAMSRLRKIDRYEEAEITAAYGGAAKMGFYEVDPNAEPDDPEFEGDEETDDEELLSEFDPFTIEKLPAGYKFKAWDPQHPAGNYDPFMGRMLRAVASGFMMAYHSLANDRSDANYGSQRGGTLEDRDIFKLLQQWLIDWVCDDVYQEWVPYGFISGNINLSPFEMPRFRDAAEWKPRAFDWIDPLKDVTAKEKERNNGWITDTAVVAQKGGDIEDLYKEKKAELQLQESYGVTLGVQNQGKGGLTSGNPTA